MSVFYELLSVGLGLTHQLLSRWFPFRNQSAPPEVAWDIFGMVLGISFAVVYSWLVGIPLASFLRELPALEEWHTRVAAMPWAVVIAANLVLSDFIVYWTHRWLHSAMLWHSHAWHHASRHVWWLSGLRATPLHMFLTLAPYTLAHAIFTLHDSDVLAGVIIFGIVNQHWLHSNVRLPWPGLIEKVLVTPRFHFVHHSADSRFTNSNYAFMFTFWDKAFGTYTHPLQVASDELLGLDYENGHVRLILGLPPDRSASPAYDGARGRASHAAS